MKIESVPPVPQEHVFHLTLSGKELAYITFAVGDLNAGEDEAAGYDHNWAFNLWKDLKAAQE